MSFHDVEKSDVVLSISVLILLGVILTFRWSMWEVVLMAIAIGVANYSGTIKQTRKKINNGVNELTV